MGKGWCPVGTRGGPAGPLELAAGPSGGPTGRKGHPVTTPLGILLSGRGSNFEAIADRIAAGKLNAEIAVVISNVESAPGLERAGARGLKTVFIPSRNRSREDFDREAVEGGQKRIDSLGTFNFVGEVLANFFIGKTTLLAAFGNKVAEIVIDDV